MKITEVTTTKLTALRESLEADSMLTEQAVNNLMMIAEQAEHGTWSKAMTLEESLAEDARILAAAGITL